MDPGDALATIAESRLGIRSDAWSDRSSIYGYLMAANTHKSPSRTSNGMAGNLAVFGTRSHGKTELHWVRPGFGTPTALHAPQYSLLPELHPDPGPPAMLRFHNWCAAFVDWCVRDLLLRYPSATSVPFAHRPQTTMAVGFLAWGRRNGCEVFEGGPLEPRRGDIAVYTFHLKSGGDQNHVGIVSLAEPKSQHLHTIEGNTSEAGHGNQGHAVVKRMRPKSQLKGLVRLTTHR